jgi:hypothetical protein
MAEEERAASEGKRKTTTESPGTKQQVQPSCGRRPPRLSRTGQQSTPMREATLSGTTHHNGGLAHRSLGRAHG